MQSPIIILLLTYCVSAEIYTSIANLEQLINSENKVADLLDEYIASEQQRLESLKQKSKEFRDHSKLASLDVEAYLSNPVNAYLTVKLFTSDWSKVVGIVESGEKLGKVMLENVGELYSIKPNKDDLLGAVNALLRLQDVYELSTKQIASGNLKGVNNSPHLSAEECFEIGKQAYNEEDYYHSSLWFQYILEKESNNGVNKIFLLDYLAFSTYQQGNIRYALNLTMQIVEIDPDHQRALNNIYYYNEEIRDSNIPEDEFMPLKKNRKLDEYRSSKEFKDYEALCRDEKIMTYEHAHKLNCRYVHSHPIFVLLPLKEEELYLDPRLVVFHNFITDAEIAKVKELAKPRLMRATIQNPITGILETASYRVSKSAWLKDPEHPLIRRISLKSAAASSLSLDTVEDLQVLNYGIGGHYEPHYDFAREHDKSTFSNSIGNRIATVIYYMTDVEAGGSTAFISMGVNVKPKKGSCAMWYNLRRNGEGDMKTKHAACPVLVGQKWVCNKWFHERGQEFKRPCSLDENL